jgi:hypothetical protein
VFGIPLPFPVCVCVPRPPTEFCIDFPFGVKICSNRGTIFRFEGLDGMMLKFVGNLQPLLAPLMPILVVISIVKALIDCIQAIPDAISTLSPDPIYDCLERLAELFPQLFQMIPPFSYLEFINNLILFMISLLEAFIDAINKMLAINIQTELDLLPDDDRLRCCLDENIRAFFDQIAAALRMSGTVFGILAQLLGILEIPGTKKFIKPLRLKIQALDGLTAEGIDVGTITLLQDIQNILRDISNVIAAIGASPIAQILQKANDCACTDTV